MLTCIPAQQSPVLAISWIRDEHVRFGCHAWLRFSLWNWSSIIFLFWCAFFLRFQAHNFRTGFGTMCKDLSVVGFEPTTSCVKRERSCPTSNGTSADCLSLTWTIWHALCHKCGMLYALCPPGFICWLYIARHSTCRSPVYINHCTSCCTAVPVDL